MKHDWLNIEVLHTVGNDTLKALGERFNIPADTIRKYAGRHKWSRKRHIYRESIKTQFIDAARTDAVLIREDFDSKAHTVCDLAISQAALTIAGDNDTEALTAILDQATKATALKYRLLDVPAPRQPIDLDSTDAFEKYQVALALARAQVETQADPDDGMIEVELVRPGSDVRLSAE